MDVLGQYLDDRQARPAHLETVAPDQLVGELLKHLRAQFYTADAAQRFYQDQKALMATLTWPATWLTQRGVSLSVPRYEAILREIIVGIQRHGDTAKIKHFPTYFQHCVRLWFVHNGEELYEERKRIRNSIDLRLLSRLPAAAPAGPDPMEALATAHRVLATSKRRAKAASAKIDQLPLL